VRFGGFASLSLLLSRLVDDFDYLRLGLGRHLLDHLLSNFDVLG